MRDYLTCGPNPTAEEWTHSNNNTPEAIEESKRWLAMLRKVFADGIEDDRVSFAIKTFPHDSGSYSEVCCIYYDHDEESCDYCNHVEVNLPERWTDDQPCPLARTEVSDEGS